MVLGTPLGVWCGYRWVKKITAGTEVAFEAVCIELASTCRGATGQHTCYVWPVMQPFGYASILCMQTTAMCIYIYDLLRQQPLIHPALLPHAGDGHVHIYDLLRQQPLIQPVITLDTSAGRPVHAMAFNTKRPEMFATGGDARSIMVGVDALKHCELIKHSG